MAKRKGKTVISVIVGIVLILLLAMGIGIIYRFTNGFNEDFKTFYIEHGGEKILTGESKMKLQNGKKYRFDVKYTFDFASSESRNYNVKILLNVENFEYQVGDQYYKPRGAIDVTKGFDITLNDTYFELAIPDGFNLQHVFDKLYEGATVVLPEKAGEIESTEHLYSLIVSSYNESVTYRINFYFNGMKLDADRIIFGGDALIGGLENQFGIGYDTLGSGSVKSVKFECAPIARAKDEVTFHVSLVDLSDEYDDYRPLTISRIVVQNSKTGEEEIELGSGEGTFTFTMPAHSVTVMIYLINPS